jgi:A/G-specific adenine glycosylase
MVSYARMRKVYDRVIEWFMEWGRSYPWRTTTDTFHILIAEMLLRRTTATAVAKVYPHFIERYGTPSKLSQARTTSVKALLLPLGLQSVRTNHLLRTAHILVESYNSQVPNTYENLASLPGVGRYVASAVLNFGFEISMPLIDGNIIHLLNRVFAQQFTGPSDSRAWEFVDKLGQPHHDRRFYWGVIDLVAMTCLRKKPRCTKCPLSVLCKFSIANDVALKGPQ